MESLENDIRNLSVTPKVKPFLKWVGGKTQIIDTILARFPTKMKAYHEPFVGGGSVLLAALSSDIHVSGKIYASDINVNLINLYKTIQESPNEFLNEVSSLFNDYNNCTVTKGNRKPSSYTAAKESKESYYYYIRDRYNTKQSELSTLQISSMFLFLNKTCFRGLYREGPNGFNVPFGNYYRPFEIDTYNILAVSSLIQNVVFKAQGYQDSLENTEDGDFVYLDPPYVPAGNKSFTKYTSDDFSQDQHTQLFKSIKNHKILFLMSNSDTPLVNDTFKDFSIDTIPCKRRINSKNPASIINEVLVYN